MREYKKDFEMGGVRFEWPLLLTVVYHIPVAYTYYKSLITLPNFVLHLVPIQHKSILYYRSIDTLLSIYRLCLQDPACAASYSKYERFHS